MVIVTDIPLTAHCQAATNPKTLVLHRDISGGNILIYPRVTRNEDSTRAMVWRGILSDWELSRPVDDEYSPSKATQAEQMVSSHFLQCLRRPLSLVRREHINSCPSTCCRTLQNPLRSRTSSSPFSTSSCTTPSAIFDRTVRTRRRTSKTTSTTTPAPDVCTRVDGSRWPSRWTSG